MKGWKSSTISVKSFISDAWKGSKYVSGSKQKKMPEDYQLKS